MIKTNGRRDLQFRGRLLRKERPQINMVVLRNEQGVLDRTVTTISL